MACQPPLMAPGALIQATTISSVGSRIAAMAARARAKDEGGSSNEAVPISCWSACATRSIMLFIDLAPPVHPRKFIAIKPVPLNRVFQMLARLGDVIYSVGCIAAAAILGLGIFDYWFGQGGLVALISWVVLAAGLWLIGEAIRYILTARW